MRILELAFSALHLFPAPGIVNYPEAINIYRELQTSGYQTVARDELRAINDIRVKQGLPALDERGQPQGENHVYQAR
jgi:hypothetical protein